MEEQLDIYQTNLAILRVKYPHIYRRLKDAETKSVRIVNSKRQNYPTVQLHDERGDYFLHSVYDPVEEAKKVIDKLDIREISSIWMFGTGMGYHILELLNKRNKGFVTVIVEPDLNLFDIFLHTNIATEALKWTYFTFSVGNQEMLEEDIEILLSSKLHFAMGKVQIIALPGFERHQGGVYKKLVEKISKQSKYRYNSLGNSVQDTLDGLNNSFGNIEKMIKGPGIAQLEGKYKGIPAVVVSAGPSLDKNVDLLHQIKGKGLILSSDTVFPKLLKKGITPDMVFSIERIPEVWERFYDGVEIPPETWLVALNVVEKRVFDAFDNHCLIAYRATEPLSTWLDRVSGQMGTLPTGLSVSNMAYSAAALMGCDPVVLIGQDLAFGPDDQYYASGGITGNRGEEDQSGIVWVEDYDGNPIKTTVMLKHFLDWFENAFKGAPCEVIDATEGGARIAGTTIMTLQEVIDEYMNHGREIVPFGEELEESNHTTYSILEVEVQMLIDEFVQVIDILEDRIDEIEQFDKGSGELSEGEIANRYQDILNEVMNAILFRGRLAFLLQAVTTAGATRLGLFGQLKTTEDINKFKEFSKRFYEELQQSSEICMYTLRKIKNNIAEYRLKDSDGGEGNV